MRICTCLDGLNLSGIMIVIFTVTKKDNAITLQIVISVLVTTKGLHSDIFAQKLI